MDSTKQHVIAVLHLLSATYGHMFGPDQAQAYVATLADIEADLLKAAALRFIEQNTYPRIPTPGELRQHAAAIMTKAAGVVDAPAAWGEVMHQLRYAGSWHQPRWSNELIAQAVEDTGGWSYLCNSENVMADRARFIQAYEIRVQRRTQDMMQLPASEQYATQLAARIRLEPLRLISDAAAKMTAATASRRLS